MHILYLASVLYTYTLWTILTFERPTNRPPPPWPFHTFQGFFLLLLYLSWYLHFDLARNIFWNHKKSPDSEWIFLHHIFPDFPEHFFKVLSLSFHDCHWFSGRLSMFSLTSSYLMLHLSQFRWKWKPADMIIWIFGICGWGCYLLVYLL